MQVYEKLNQLKDTAATLEQIKAWSYMNRITPCELEQGLELDCEYPQALVEAQERVCARVGMDCMECLEQFFVEEMEVVPCPRK